MNTDRNDWIGLTVGEVLEQCKCAPDEFQYIDEPPGKLRAVEITCKSNDDKQKIVLEITYDSNLFSIDRDWSFDLVKKQKIVKVHISDEPFF